MAEEPATRPTPQLPSSYRGLVNGVQSIEQAGKDVVVELAQARSDAAELRKQLDAERLLASQLTASQASLRNDSRMCRQEAAELWAVHEEPLRQQESVLASSARTSEELQRAADAGDAAVTTLKAECNQLEGTCVSLRRNAAHLQDNHAGYIPQVERASERNGDLAMRHDESELAFEAAQKASAAKLRLRTQWESEMSAGQAELRSLQQELSELERDYKRGASNVWASYRSGSEALSLDVQTLRSELHQEERALEAPTQESATLRDRTFRTESALVTMLGQDVAGGLRALKRRCELYAAQRDEPNGVVGAQPVAVVPAQYPRPGGYNA